jgi:hypothetical protein
MGDQMSVCEVPGCDREVTRIINGRGYCSDHREGNLRSEIAIVRCEAAGGDCGLPAMRVIAGYSLCAVHEPRHCPPPRAA